MPCDVYPHQRKTSDIIGKLRSTEVVLDNFGAEEHILYINVWDDGKCTDVYIEE
jgi:hypothetical protein